MNICTPWLSMVKKNVSMIVKIPPMIKITHSTSGSPRFGPFVMSVCVASSSPSSVYNIGKTAFWFSVTGSIDLTVCMI